DALDQRLANIGVAPLARSTHLALDHPARDQHHVLGHAPRLDVAADPYAGVEGFLPYRAAVADDLLDSQHVTVVVADDLQQVAIRHDAGRDDLAVEQAVAGCVRAGVYR